MRSLYVSHIVLTTEDVANVLLDHLREYDDPKLMMKTFARLAKQYCACGSRNNGGELGWMEAHTSAPEFFEAAQAAKAHELSGPVKTTFGYHIYIITEEEAVGDTGIDGINVPTLGAGNGTL